MIQDYLRLLLLFFRDELKPEIKQEFEEDRDDSSSSSDSHRSPSPPRSGGSSILNPLKEKLMQSKCMLRVVDHDIEGPYKIVPDIFDVFFIKS